MCLSLFRLAAIHIYIYIYIISTTHRASGFQGIEVGLPQNWGYHFAGSHNKVYHSLGSIRGHPYLGKLPG